MLKKNKLGMSALISHPEQKSIEEQIRIFAAAGFDSFFLSSGVTEEFERIPAWAHLARTCGIEPEAVHSPTRGVDRVWQEGADSAPYALATRRVIDLCGEGGVQRLVLHVGTSPAIQPCERGIAFWRELEHYARSRGVRLCYENSNVPRLFAAVVEGADPWHGVCHDVGHQHCYTPDAAYEQICADRILYTHLHDNLGDGRDMHLLPGDGGVDFAAYFAALARAGYAGTLNLELSCYHAPAYREMSFADFALAARERLAQLLMRA